MLEAAQPLLKYGIKIHYYKKEHPFIHAGFPLASVWILVTGNAKVVCYNPIGDESTQDTLPAPQLFGLIELVDNRSSYGATVKTSEGSQLIEIPAEYFFKILESFSDTARVLIQNLSWLATRNMDYVEYLSLYSGADMLAMFIYNYCKKGRSPYIVSLKRKELAELLHINLRSLYRYLNTLQNRGFCSVTNGKITISDTEFHALKEYFQ